MAEHTPEPLDVEASFEAWATVSARLLGRTEVQAAAVVAELGLGERWPRAEAKWTARLARDMSNGVLGLVERYAEACARELATRRRAADREPSSTEPTARGAAGAEPAAAGSSEWPLERYAQYCAELYTWPSQSNAIDARFGLAEPAVRAGVHRSWHARLSTDRALYDRWTELVTRARAALAGR